MMMRSNRDAHALVLSVALVPAILAQRRGGADNRFPAVRIPTDRCGRRRRSRGCFAGRHTEYAILAPGSEEFRIRFLPEENRAGATELVNATRGGSGSDIRSTIRRQAAEVHLRPEATIRESRFAALPIPVRPAASGVRSTRPTDPRTYIMHGDDIAWVHSLSRPSRRPVAKGSASSPRTSPRR